MEIGVLATIGCGGENGTPRGWESAIVIGSMRESETETAFLHRHWTLKVGDCQNMEMKALCVSDYIFEGGSIVTRGPIRGRCVQWQFAGYPAIPQILQRKGRVCAATAQIIAFLIMS